MMLKILAFPEELKEFEAIEQSQFCGNERLRKGNEHVPLVPGPHCNLC